MKNCLIVNPYWDSLGGGERYVATFARLLLDLGFTVDILWRENISDQLMTRFGIDLTAANWLNCKYAPALSFRYKTLFWVSDGSLPVSLASKTLIHMQFPFTGVGGSSLASKIKSSFYTFVVNSHFTKSFIDSEYGVDSRVVHPPIDTNQFIGAKKQKNILYVGRFSQLTQSKGQHHLIDAFRKLAAPGWRLVLAGGASVGTSRTYMDSLEKKVGKLPVDIITNPDFSRLRELYANASLFWSAAGFGFDDQKNPTKVEHFGISLVEAMAAGCVPVVTALGGHKEIVTDGKDGFLWNSPGELVQKTKHLINSPVLLKEISLQSQEKSKIFATTVFNQHFQKLVL